MNLLFYFGHPSQYLFLRSTIRILRDRGHKCEILIKSKDVLEALLVEDKESYLNILPEGRKSSKFGLLAGLIKRDYRLFRYLKNCSFDLFVGTDPSLAQIGFLKRIPIITVLEDDINVIPELAYLTFPFTSIILTPTVCKTGKYENKTIHYDGYMKLGYLHPNRFEIKPASIRQPYFLVRVSSLKAYHDSHIRGFSESVLEELIETLKDKGSVYISSERPLNKYFQPFELKISPSEMQQVLANSRMLISDSQSMSMEAAMLGIPSVRFSSFSGRISVLEELEHSYNLTYGIPAENPQRLFEKIKELLSISDLKNEYEKRHRKMLSEKIDVTAFLVWFIENFPSSCHIMKDNPLYQVRFR